MEKHDYGVDYPLNGGSDKVKRGMCTVLVMCRNATLDLAQLTGGFIKRFWSDCGCELVLCTQTERPGFDLYDRIIYTNDEMIWGDRLKIAMDSIDTKYVFLLAEDFFLKDKVDNKAFLNCLNVMERYDLGAVWASGAPVFSKPLKAKGKWRIIPSDSIYRVCLQPVIFNAGYLRRFAGLHFSPWQFERKASLMSRYMNEKVLAVTEPIYPCVHAWSHGMWSKEAVDLMKREGIEESFYSGKKVYPWYLVWKDRLAMCVIRIAPHLVTNIRIMQSEKGEKKLLY